MKAAHHLLLCQIFLFAVVILCSVYAIVLLLGEQGWRSGESTRLLTMLSGFTDSRGVICGLSLLLVLVLAPRSFSPGSPVFPSPEKPTFPNSNSIRNLRATGLSPTLNKVYLFYLFFVFLICSSSSADGCI